MSEPKYRVAVASESALKIRAVEAAFKLLDLTAQVTGCKTTSGVGIQPIGLKEMKIGATNRVYDASSKLPADFYVAIENGLIDQDGRWFDVPYILIIEGNRTRSASLGTYFPVPMWMVDRAVHEKTELGEIVKGLAGGGEKDSMKYLSMGTVSREAILTQAILCALVPLLFKERNERRV